MAAPLWLSTTESEEPAWTRTHDIDLGTFQPANHLIIGFSKSGGTTTVSDPAGWTRVVYRPVSSNAANQWYVWIRQMDGTESSTLTISTTQPDRSSTQVLRFSGARAGVVEDTTWAVEALSSGFGTVINPPSATAPWGSGNDITVIAMAPGIKSGVGAAVSAYPAGFSNTNATAANVPTVMSATKEITGTDTDDPGTFTVDSSVLHRATTVLLREAAAVVAGAGVASVAVTAGNATADPPTTVATAETAAVTADAVWAQVPFTQVPSDLVVEWDFDNDGDFDESVEDITEYVLAGWCRRGRDYASQVTGRSTPGAMSIVLDNSTDRFSFFNASSPVNTGPYSLQSGRLIRIRTSEAATTDPLTLVRDLFSGSGPLTTADTGETWTTRTSLGWSENERVAITDGPPDPSSGADHIETVDCGDTTYYAQIIATRRDTTNLTGITYHWTDANNYGRLQWGDGTLALVETVAGTPSTVATTGIENRDDIAIGLAVNGTTLLAYVDGVEELTATSTLTATNHVGLFGRWFSQRPPEVDEFRVWDRSRIVQAWESVDLTGVLATMKVESCVPEIGEDHHKIARLTGIGLLGQLDREITPPSSTGPDDIQSAGSKPGHIIGNTLARVAALHPPAEIQPGDLTLGSVGFDRQRAISIARAVEATEAGFVWESRDGAIRFDRRSARDGTAVVETFTDDPTVAGLPFRLPTQRNWRGDIINRVRSEVSPSLPRDAEETTDFAVTGLGGQNDVTVTMPAEGTGDTEGAIGDLFIVVLASTVRTEGVLWSEPPGWTLLRSPQDEFGTRVYAKQLAAGDFGDEVTFYDDSDAAGGAWASVTFLIKNWYGVISSGVAVTEFAGFSRPEAANGDNDPPVMFTPWPIGPTLFLAIRVGIGSDSSGGTVGSVSDDLAPDGFDSLGSHFIGGSANTEDVAIQWCRRIRTQSVVNPGPFGGQFTGFDQVETAVIAIRGFAGDPPPSSGGLPVVSVNTQSQVDRGAVLDHPNPGRLFETETAAETYNDHQLTRFDQDRPIVEFEFVPTMGQRVRDFGAAVDLSDRVRFDADGNTGFGIDAEFFVETITHSFSEGATLWTTRLACAPATDPGGGAD